MSEPIDAPSQAALSDRLGRLEKELRRWRLGAVGGLTLGLAALCFGAAAKAPPRVVEANEFRVVNREGKPIAKLWEWNGNPRLELGAPGSQFALVEVDLQTGLARVSVSGPDGRNRASLAASAGQDCYVSASAAFLVDPKHGDTRLRAKLKDNAVAVDVLDAAGRVTSESRWPTPGPDLRPPAVR